MPKTAMCIWRHVRQSSTNILPESLDLPEEAKEDGPFTSEFN